MYCKVNNNNIIIIHVHDYKGWLHLGNINNWCKSKASFSTGVLTDVTLYAFYTHTLKTYLSYNVWASTIVHVVIDASLWTIWPAEVATSESQHFFLDILRPQCVCLSFNEFFILIIHYKFSDSDIPWYNIINMIYTLQHMNFSWNEHLRTL